MTINKLTMLAAGVLICGLTTACNEKKAASLCADNSRYDLAEYADTIGHVTRSYDVSSQKFYLTGNSATVRDWDAEVNTYPALSGGVNEIASVTSVEETDMGHLILFDEYNCVAAVTRAPEGVRLVAAQDFDINLIQDVQLTDLNRVHQGLEQRVLTFSLLDCMNFDSPVQQKGKRSKMEQRCLTANVELQLQSEHEQFKGKPDSPTQGGPIQNVPVQDDRYGHDNDQNNDQGYEQDRDQDYDQDHGHGDHRRDWRM